MPPKARIRPWSANQHTFARDTSIPPYQFSQPAPPAVAGSTPAPSLTAQQQQSISARSRSNTVRQASQTPAVAGSTQVSTFAQQQTNSRSRPRSNTVSAQQQPHALAQPASSPRRRAISQVSAPPSVLSGGNQNQASMGTGTTQLGQGARETVRGPPAGSGGQQPRVNQAQQSDVPSVPSHGQARAANRIPPLNANTPHDYECAVKALSKDPLLNKLCMKVRRVLDAVRKHGQGVISSQTILAIFVTAIDDNVPLNEIEHLAVLFSQAHWNLESMWYALARVWQLSPAPQPQDTFDMSEYIKMMFGCISMPVQPTVAGQGYQANRPQPQIAQQQQQSRVIPSPSPSAQYSGPSSAGGLTALSIPQNGQGTMTGFQNIYPSPITPMVPSPGLYDTTPIFHPAPQAGALPMGPPEFQQASYFEQQQQLDAHAQGSQPTYRPTAGNEAFSQGNFVVPTPSNQSEGYQYPTPQIPQYQQQQQEDYDAVLAAVFAANGHEQAADLFSADESGPSNYRYDGQLGLGSNKDDDLLQVFSHPAAAPGSGNVGLEQAPAASEFVQRLVSDDNQAASGVAQAAPQLPGRRPSAPTSNLTPQILPQNMAGLSRKREAEDDDDDDDEDGRHADKRFRGEGSS